MTGAGMILLIHAPISYNTLCKITRCITDKPPATIEGGSNQTAADEAIAFGISVCNLWKRCRNWFPEFKDIHIRITMDYGTVKTNSYGGLWSGYTICCANKMKQIENFVNIIGTIKKE